MEQTYILVDFENVQPPDMGLLSGTQYQLRIFRGPHQKKLDFDIAESLQPLGDRVKYIQSDRQGKNALDFHIAFYMGRLLEGLEANATPATRNTRFVVISHDGGFDALISHVQSLGYAATKAVSIRDALGLDAPPVAVARTEAVRSQSVVPGLSKQSAPPKEAAPATPAASPAKAKPAPAKPIDAVAKKQAPTRKSLGQEDKEKVVEHLRSHPKNRPVKRKTLESHIASVLGSNVTAKAVRGLVAVLENEGIIKFNENKIDEYKIPRRKK